MKSRTPPHLIRWQGSRDLDTLEPQLLPFLKSDAMQIRVCAIISPCVIQMLFWLLNPSVPRRMHQSHVLRVPTASSVRLRRDGLGDSCNLDTQPVCVSLHSQWKVTIYQDGFTPKLWILFGHTSNTMLSTGSVFNHETTAK